MPPDDADDLPDSPPADEAARWAARRMDRSRWTPRDESQFRAWLAASPEHEIEMAEYEATLRSMSRRDAFAPGEIDRVVDGCFRNGLGHGRRWFRTVVLAAAAVVMLCVALRLFLGTSEVITTGIAERRDVTLRDGTRVRLDAGTTVRARIAWWRRTVDLAAGEAVFEVEPARGAFVVRAGGCEIRDIGTVFSVQVLAPDATREGGVEVAVREGIVEVRSAGNARGGMVRLSAGELVAWNGQRALPRAKSFEKSRFASWRDGRRHYEADPLRQIVADLQRSTHERIEFRDALLAEMGVTGTMGMDRPGETLDVLTAILPLRVIREPGRIVLALESGRDVTPVELVR